MAAGLSGVQSARGRRARKIVLSVVLAGASALLPGCGGEDGDSQAGGGNRAPTIGGSPSSQVMQNQSYSFTPSASDPDGDALTFSVNNRPAWASFDAATGLLNGTPSAADVGMYSNIRISVSDGAASADLAPFSVQVVATTSGAVTLNWVPPSLNTDGSPLTNLAGFKLYWGQSVGAYPNSIELNNPGLTSYVVDQLTPATWYFAMSALNTQGVESALSSPASKLIQ